MQDMQSHNDRSGQITGAFILIGLGTLFLLINTGVIPGWGKIWPAILIVIGFSLLLGSFFKKKKSPDNGQI